MISVPDASCASRITSIEEYFPVPTISREVNSLPPSTSLVSSMPLASPHRPNDLHSIPFRQRHRPIVGLPRDLAIDRDGRVLALDVQEGEQRVHGEVGLDIH